MSAPNAPLLAAPFCFLRHGETENNRLGLIAGSADVALNATGLSQARLAAQRLAHGGIDAIWSSPLERARASAQCVAETLGLPIVFVPQLAERNWGELEGKPRELRIAGVTPSGGESIEAFRARTLAGLQQIRASGLPLIVAHSGTFRILSEWLQIPPRSAALANCMPLGFAPHAGGWRVTPL
ncbi:MAG: histidine phosphatase family protein [Betaproteobacteria bacterium]|nr:histidine phosphatase family protein [Betaproteobacteria bacterium]